MSVQDSKQSLKELAGQLMQVVSALDMVATGDKEIETLIKRRDDVSKMVSEVMDKLKAAQKEYGDKAAAMATDYENQKKAIEAKIQAGQDAIRELTATHSKMRDAMRDELSNERASMVAERQQAVTRLDQQIAQKTKQLEELNAAIQEGKRRFA